MARVHTRGRKVFQVVAWVVVGYIWAVQLLLGPFAASRETWIVGLCVAVLGAAVALWIRDPWLGVLAVAAPFAEFVMGVAAAVVNIVLQWLIAGVNLIAVAINGDQPIPQQL